MSRKDIENLGFAVIATSSWSDGSVKFEAHRLLGRRRLVKGERMSNADLAYESLHQRCFEIGDR